MNQINSREEEFRIVTYEERREILRVEGLTKHFPIDRGLFGQPKKWVQAVDDVSFGVRDRGTVAIVGESGSGKTTAGRTIARLLKPTGGKIYFDGNDIASVDEHSLRDIRKDIQMVFQNPSASLNPRMTVRQLVSEPLIVHSWPKEERRSRISELLETVDLPQSYVDRYPHEFSGGQRQRIAIARALAIRPKVIIFDEPVSALDVSVQAQIIQLLDRIQADTGLASIFISHDLSVVRAISDEVVVLYLGKVMEAGPSRKLFSVPRHPYTQALISAVPKMDKRKKQDARIVLQGDIPDPANPPSGCRFRTRCWKAQQICANKTPELKENATNHFVACHFPD